MAQSLYQRSWDALKQNNEITVQLKVRPETTRAERERAVLKFRKALSRRKELDSHFQIEYPTARIVRESVDWDNMLVKFALKYLPDENFLLSEGLSSL